MLSGASITVERLPYMVRTGFTLGQSSAVIVDWVVRNGAKKIVTIVNDWAPGLESEAVFRDHAVKGGAEIVESMRIPLANPDFAPFLQRAQRQSRHPVRLLELMPSCPRATARVRPPSLACVRRGLEPRSEEAASIATALLLFQLLVAVTLIHIDLTRQRKTPIKGQMGYRNEMWAFRIRTANIQAAENASHVPSIKNVDYVALTGDGDIRRLLCHRPRKIRRYIRLNRK
jgi:Periplasmic binding protein